MIGVKISEERYIVELMAQERERLLRLVNKGRAASWTLLKARILLKTDTGCADGGWTDGQIATAPETNIGMIYRVRRQLVEEGFEAVLICRKCERPPIPLIFDGEKQARLTALACSQPPQSHARWTIRLLAEKVVEPEIVETVHFNTVGRALKEIPSSPI